MAQTTKNKKTEEVKIPPQLTVGDMYTLFVNIQELTEKTVSGNVPIVFDIDRDAECDNHAERYGGYIKECTRIKTISTILDDEANITSVRILLTQ